MKRKKLHPVRAGPEKNKRAITRRDALKGALGLGAMAALSSCAYIEKDSGSVTKRSVLAQADLIRRENGKAGTRDWLLTNTRIANQRSRGLPSSRFHCSRTSSVTGDLSPFTAGG